jgi:hypothetical protein
MRAETTEVLTATITARKAIDSRAYQAKIQRLELDRIASRQRAELDALEQQRDALHESLGSFRASFLQTPALLSWHRVLDALEQLLTAIDDDVYEGLVAGMGMADRELRTAAEQIKGELPELEIGIRRFAHSRRRTAKEVAPERPAPAKDGAVLADIAMAKLARMRTEREDALAGSPSLIRRIKTDE